MSNGPPPPPPEEYVKVMADSFILMGRKVSQKNTPTTEDVRAMVISCHISAEQHGWRPTNGEPSGVEEPPEGEPVKPQANGSYGEYREKTQVASEKSINYMHVVIKEAMAKVRAEKNLSLNAAEKEVKHNIMDTFQEYWGFEPNLTAPKGRINQGQVSMIIDYTKTEWGLE